MRRFSLLRECKGLGPLSTYLLLFLSTFIIFSVSTPSRVHAAHVTLEWDASTGSGLAGYKVYYGRSSRQYTTSLDVKKRRTCTVTGLRVGRLYYFAATAYDKHGNESDYSVEIAYRIPVPSSNHVPSAVNDKAKTVEDRRVVIDVLANDTDPDGDALAVVAVGQAAKGSVHTNGRTITYIPNTNRHGWDSFTYKVNDGRGGNAKATVDVFVAAVNDAPVASNRFFGIWEETERTGRLCAKDSDGDALTYRIVTKPVKGRVALVDVKTGSFTYIPKPGAEGPDSFTFTANDGTLDSNIATVSLTIRPHVRIWLEAEEGYVSPPMRIVSDVNASQGRFVRVPYNAGNFSNPSLKAGYAEYTFAVPEPGRYVLFARVVADSTSRNSFFISVDDGDYIRWDTAIGAAHTWIWDEARKEGMAKALGFRLRRGRHTLCIKQCEAGVRIDKIGIVSRWDRMLGRVYEDAEDGAVRGWDIYDGAPGGAQISNVFDTNRRSRVIELKGSGLKNGYRLRRGNLLDWSNSRDRVIEWSLRYDEDFKVNITTETTAGIRYIQYAPGSDDLLGKRETVRFGLGKAITDGQWHRFVRNLQADLEKAQPGVQILKVNSFLIRGSGRVDDIKLRRFP